MTVYQMSDILTMYPLLVSISQTIELKTNLAKATAKELDEMVADTDNYRDNLHNLSGLEHKLDDYLEGMLEATAEANAFGIDICNPLLGGLDIPCQGASSKALVFVCFDHTCERDSDKLMCHQTQLGHKSKSIIEWNQT